MIQLNSDLIVKLLKDEAHKHRAKDLESNYNMNEADMYLSDQSARRKNRYYKNKLSRGK